MQLKMTVLFHPLEVYKEMIGIRKKAKQYFKNHPETKDEFFDLINSDPQFNYSKVEIIDWVADYFLDTPILIK